MSDFPGFGKKGTMESFAGMAPEAIIMIVILAIVALAIMGAIAITWGILTFIGVFLMVMAMIIVALNRGAQHQPWMFIIVIVLGFVLVALGMMGVGQQIVVDLGVIPGMRVWHDFIGLGG
jgi:hypothetical protein